MTLVTSIYCHIITLRIIENLQIIDES